MNTLFVYQTPESMYKGLMNTVVLNGVTRWNSADIIMDNNDRIQFRLLRTLEDCNQIAGCEYGMVQFVGEPSEDVRLYVMTRMRQPYKE